MNCENTKEKYISANAPSYSERKYINESHVEIYRHINNRYDFDKELSKDCVILIFGKKISGERVFVVIYVPINSPLYNY